MAIKISVEEHDLTFLLELAEDYVRQEAQLECSREHAACIHKMVNRYYEELWAARRKTAPCIDPSSCSNVSRCEDGCIGREEK